MDDQTSAGPAASSPSSGLEILEQLERRVLDLVGELLAAREAQRNAEAEAERLRDQVQERDTLIASLKHKLEGDDVRNLVRERLEALLRRIDEMERGN